MTAQALPPFISLLFDFLHLLWRPNHLKFQPNHSIFGRQHRREYYTNREGRTKGPSFSHHLHYNLKPVFFTWQIVFRDSRQQEYKSQNTFLPSQRLVVPPQAITALSRWCCSTLLHQLSSLTINWHPIVLARCTTLPSWIFLLPEDFVECLARLSHFLLFISLNSSTTTLTSNLSCKGTYLNRIQNSFSPFLDLPLSSPHLFTLKRNVNTRPKRQSNSFSNT